MKLQNSGENLRVKFKPTGIKSELKQNESLSAGINMYNTKDKAHLWGSYYAFWASRIVRRGFFQKLCRQFFLIKWIFQKGFFDQESFSKKSVAFFDQMGFPSTPKALWRRCFENIFAGKFWKNTSQNNVFRIFLIIFRSKSHVFTARSLTFNKNWQQLIIFLKSVENLNKKYQRGVGGVE